MPKCRMKKAGSSLFSQTIHSFGVNLGIFHEDLNFPEFVGEMFTNRITRENGSKGNDIRNGLGIGAAAETSDDRGSTEYRR